jgi:nucleotide-binding universal stress UspA family protein
VSRLARVYDAEVVLLRVGEGVPVPADVDFPAWAPPQPYVDEEDLREGLEKHRRGFERDGVSARAVALFDERVPEAILQAVERERADLVALATHGRSGFDRWLFGSVVEKVVRHCPVPLLVHRVGGLLPRNGDGSRS